MQNKYKWELELGEFVDSVVPDSDKAHDIGHSLKVIARVKELLAEPEYKNSEIDTESLIAAAYLHDVGYHYLGNIESADSFEHIAAGVQAAKDILPKLEFPTQKIDTVLYLILNHDNAKWGLKNANLEGQICRLNESEIANREETSDPNTLLALQVLKEADSYEYTDLRGTERTWNYSTEKGMPVLPNPSYKDALNANTLSNLLIFPHLAWLNAHTKTGKKLAARGYQAAEKWVSDYCAAHNLEYTRDEHPALLVK